MEFLNYSGAVFSLSSIAILCAGTVGGLLLGATPGLSPTLAVALLIFTFHMEPAQGLMLLGAAYTSTVAGGAVSAILLRIPGAPANIPTALDGYAMARKGDGAKALQMCFVSSAIGGVIGILVLISRPLSWRRGHWVLATRICSGSPFMGSPSSDRWTHARWSMVCCPDASVFG